eukprot:Skav220339  [mRNA]  locus=scaffold4823:37926:43067:- [translate_table: standard]
MDGIAPQDATCCKYCQGASAHMVEDSGADHEQSMEDESTERLHQELSGITPEGMSPGCHCLEFDSWWNEGKQRRFIYIRPVLVDGLHYSFAVTVWDLHVGAEVDILGRMTTLQRAQLTVTKR